MDPFRTFEHAGRVLPLYAYEDPSGGSESGSGGAPPVRAPGTGDFTVEELQVSSTDDGLLLTARVAGKNIAYIYAETHLKDPDAERYYGPIAREYVRPGHDATAGGVTRPVWGNPVEVMVTVCPSLRVLTDGRESAFACAAPRGYAGPVYELDGLYWPAGREASLRASLTFDSAGAIKSFVAYKQQGRKLLPGPARLVPGDCFAPFVRVLERGAEAGAWKETVATSTRLTVLEQGLRVVTETALPGDYLVGLALEDLNGRVTRAYLQHAV